MSSLDTLTDRIRSEFRELPGLKITFQQACRLWHSNEAQCLAALEALISEGVLTRSSSGAFIALSKRHHEPHRLSSAFGDLVVKGSH